MRGLVVYVTGGRWLFNHVPHFVYRDVEYSIHDVCRRAPLLSSWGAPRPRGNAL